MENIEATLIPYDQGQVEALLKQLLLSQGVTDVLYEGSNVSQLASVISYAIATLNVNTAINLQETILPLATKRMNVLMGARQLGYIPRNILSYKYKIQIVPKYFNDLITSGPDAGEIDIESTKHHKVSIKRDTSFKNGSNTYWYRGPEISITISNKEITAAKRANKYPEDKFPVIEVIEGELITKAEDPDLEFMAIDYTENGIPKTRQDYLVPYDNVEENEGISVYLSYIDNNGKRIIREKQTQQKPILIDESLEYNKNSFIRLQNIILGYPAVFFEFAGFGKGIKSKTLIEFEVLKSKGPEGKATGRFTFNDSRASEIFEVLPTYKETQIGQAEESSESIKENALATHNTAGRAVTRNDYIAILRRKSNIAEADAWGGEEELPRVKGEIWFSTTPKYDIWPYAHTHVTQNYKTINKYSLVVGSLSENEKDDYTPLDTNGVKVINYRRWYHTKQQIEDIKKYLEPFKIMTMGLNHRQPLYIDFEYALRVVNYNMNYSKAETDAKIFAAIKEFFDGLNRFDTDYYAADFYTKVNNALSGNRGIDVKLKTYGVLHEKMIDTYYKSSPDVAKHQEKIIVSLAWPYENLIPNGISGNIVSEYLPRIDTENFGHSKAKLHVDYHAIRSVYPAGSIREIPLYLGNKEIGKYRVDIPKKSIELEFIFDSALKDKVFGPSKNGERDYARFEIKYPAVVGSDDTVGNKDVVYGDSNLVNIQFARNTIPRLREVSFMEG